MVIKYRKDHSSLWASKCIHLTVPMISLEVNTISNLKQATEKYIIQTPIGMRRWSNKMDNLFYISHFYYGNTYGF